MRMPTPEDLSNVPLWETYIIAQTVSATRGQIPKHAHAVAVEIHGMKIKLLFQLAKVTEEDRTNMEDILSELEAYVGQDVEVESAYEVLKERQISPDGMDGVWWVFLARADEIPCSCCLGVKGHRTPTGIITAFPSP